MTYSSRHTRTALVAYLLLAVLIIGGAAWGTYATLELDERTRLDQSNAAVRAALARIDWYLMPTVAREAGREYWEYNPCAAIDDAEAETERFRRLGGDMPRWIKLHFQVSPGNQWQSPQVPDDWCPTVSPSYDPFQIAQRRELLQSLRSTCVSYEVLAGKVATAERINRQYECLATGVQDYSPGEDVRAGDVKQEECLDAGGHWTRTQVALVPKEKCDPVDVALTNLGQAVEDSDATGRVEVTPSIMTPVWLDCVGHQSHRLAFVRTADVDGTPFFQGFLVDWDVLRSDLLALVHDILPDAELVPVEDTNDDAINRPIVMPSAALKARWPINVSSTHLLVGAAWLAVLAILGGVGMGIRNVLVLAERRTQFAYAVTHELRTPLTTLRLYTDMLASGLVAAADLPTYLKTLNQEAERLADMVNGVLEYARVENRAVRLAVKSMSVGDVLESVRSHCAPACDRAGKKLIVDVNGLGTSTITTDPQLLRQVLSNLIDNACKHTGGAEDPTIILRAEAAHGDRVAIDIEDHGPGIPSGDKHAIFKPFRRGTRASANGSGGIGLGLALARSWCRLLGGSLDLVGSGNGRGTCFRLTVPRRIPNASAVGDR
ncbi:MAG: HAMP domain-containing histidine kinase [Phycisphaerales bacterium]|nr:HAMP domain-containing histidine kinase [Phycisphaerales bacterium]